MSTNLKKKRPPTDLNQGRVVKNFKNNIPGKDWLASFFSRHQSLSRRLANNIKRVRAQVSEDVISNFIENIDKELESVPPENIFNYDESNLCDDLGKKIILRRRGTKYPETIVNATKVNFTIMLCVNAAGETVPPFIVCLIGNSFMHKLVQYRAEACPEQKTIRKKKLNVPPGKSICVTDLAEAGPSGLQQAKTI
ncbi:unnamed protein product [Parnassius apollo]|uniref:(apollo) hypothetical protein n=1 Tax=Parnassius apollo TaxID=110799 RepID=A0A8S3X5C7_PARAO|nr:unnamed protein product [Parnassius apollo]